MTSQQVSRLVGALAGLMAGMALAGAASAAAPGCAGRAHCLENQNFTAEITDFKTSTSGRYRMATATVRFQNRLDRPLVLGYVGNSGVVTDDQGNRYVIGSGGVRGIGVIGGNSIDTKFMLEPGESSDARFEFAWEPGRAIVGTQYDMDLTLREIDAISGGQYKLGKERVLHFEGPGSGATVAAAPASAAPVPAAATVATVPGAPDPCAGLPRCVSTGPFIAQMVGVVPQGTAQDRHHGLSMTIRFRNVGTEPLAIGYKSASSTATDNLGNVYYYGRAGTHDTSFSGIGLVAGNSADPSFQLNPGESRDATFKVTRFNSGGKQLGTGWTYDVVIPRLEILPSQQVRVAREYSLHFTDLTAGLPGAAVAAPATVDQAVQGILNLLKKK